LNLLGADLPDSLLCRRWNGNVLFGDRPAILQPGHADISPADLERAGEMPNEVLRGHIPFDDPQEKMFAGPARLVGGDFFDAKVLRLRLERAADPRDIRGDERQWVSCVVHAGQPTTSSY
jgi:hypothetical protein